MCHLTGILVQIVSMLWPGQESTVGSRAVTGDYIRPLPLPGDKPEPLPIKPTFLSRSASPRCRFESDVSSDPPMQIRLVGTRWSSHLPSSSLLLPLPPGFFPSSRKFPYLVFIGPRVTSSMQYSRMSQPHGTRHPLTCDRGGRCLSPSQGRAPVSRGRGSLSVSVSTDAR